VAHCRSNCRRSHTDGDRRDSALCRCNRCRFSVHWYATTSRSIVSTQTDQRRAHLRGDRRSYALLNSAFCDGTSRYTAYRKIWRLINNFCSHNKVDCSEIPIVLSNLLYHYFVIELWHILIFWLAKMPNGGMPVFWWMNRSSASYYFASFCKWIEVIEENAVVIRF